MSTWSRTPHTFVASETPTAASFNSLPGGVIAYANSAADVTGIAGTEIEVLNTGALTVPANTLLTVTINLYLEVDTAGVLAAVFLRESAATLHVFHEYFAASGGGGHRTPTLIWTFPAASTTPTYSVGVYRENPTTGSATIIAKSGSQITVRDEGPTS